MGMMCITMMQSIYMSTEVLWIFCRLLRTHAYRNVRKTATDIFSVLADAEAKAHGVPRNQVYFHEVGAVDSIVDIRGGSLPG